MKFVQRLDSILNKAPDAQVEDLIQWNEDIEKVLFADPNEQTHGDNHEDMEADRAKRQIDALSEKLQQEITTSLSKALEVDIKTNPEQQLESLCNHLQEHNTETVTVAIVDPDMWNYAEKLVQTGGNFLRWYLQVFLKQHALVYPMSSRPFQSNNMLRVILFLIVYNANLEEPVEGEIELSPSQRFARYASLLLFYSTYSPQSPNDEDMQKTHERLVTELKIIPKVLTLLTYPTQTSAPFALSLIRNIHNLLANSAGAVAAVQQTGFKYTFTTEKAPWAPKPDENTDGLITYPSIFRDILIWSLSSSPPFPGPPEDKRPELVVEILGIIFAMGGTEVSRALRYPCPNAALAQLVITSLQFPREDKRLYQVQLSTITILTDASLSFGSYLVEQNALPRLLEIAEEQIDTVVENTQVDDAAISALVPSLASLYRFSAGNPTFRGATKNIVFPPDREDHFWKLAEEQLTKDAGATANDKKVPAAKNLHPLDAPRGTLRHKLIRLTTWTESHTKRYASELLWALCDEDSKEFVLRTGLGNAMAFLGAKGLVQLPAHALK